MSTTVISSALAIEINAEHLAAVGKARQALEHARRAGELLLQAKAAVGHGGWLPWLAANVKFSERTAQAYMRLAAGWDQLAKSAVVADLPLRDALGLLAEPRLERDDDAVTRTPDEEALLAKALANRGVDTIDEHRMLTGLQRRLIGFAFDRLAAAAAAGVNHLSPDELHHALECCDDSARMCEEMLNIGFDRDRDLVVAIYAKDISKVLAPLAADIRRAQARVAA